MVKAASISKDFQENHPFCTAGVLPVVDIALNPMIS
jgi:hypothetical protein